MKPEGNFSRFKEHTHERGLLYALIRGFRYLVFRIRNPQSGEAHEPVLPVHTICHGKLELVFSGAGINVFYGHRKVTSLAGLNVGIHSLGLWTDSCKADWCLLEEKGGLLKVRVRFKELCVDQIWTIRLTSENEIEWEVISRFAEPIYINEIRYVVLVRPFYKSWFWDYHAEDFCRQDDQWHSFCQEEQPAAIVGARFPVQGEDLPSFSLEAGKGGLLPIVQSMPATSNAHIIGFRARNEQLLSEKTAQSFSAILRFYDNDTVLDEKMERLRQRDILHPPVLLDKKITGRAENSPRALLLNLPWIHGGNWGVRAGSRWPHIKDASEGRYLPFPFFLATAVSLLRQNGIAASLIDAIAEETPEDAFVERVLNSDSDYWIIETSVPSFYNDMRIIERLARGGKTLVLCGPNTEIYRPEFLQQHPVVDFVLYGEYESTLLELLQCLRRKEAPSRVKGLIYREGGKVVKNPPRELCDIDLLPWPDRTMPFMERYWDLPGDIPHPSVQMLASRGCSFGCHFCLWPQVMYQGNNYRARDLKDVVDEMEYLVGERKFKSVYFDDDTFNIGKDRMLKFCSLLKERGLQKVPWAIMARADLMDEEILREMRSAGLFAVKYGVESQEKSFLAASNKKLDLDKTTEIIKLTQDLGIKVHLTFCFGFKGETQKTIQKTLEYAMDADPDSVQFSILTPFPGTALFDELEREGKILTREWDRYDGHQSCIFEPDLLAPEDLVNAKNRAYALWEKHKRRKMKFLRGVRRFGDHWREQGLRHALKRAGRYFLSRWHDKK